MPPVRNTALRATTRPPKVRTTAGRIYLRHGVLACAALLVGCGRQGEPASPELHGARLAAVIEDVARFPAADATAGPFARINSLLAAPDASHRVFVNDMTGAIRVFRDGVLEREPFLDVAAARKDRFTSENLFEQGLATFAFHPDFAQPGQPGFHKFYTFATELRANSTPTFAQSRMTASGHHDVIVEWSVDAANENRIDPASAREVMRIAHPRHDHVGGQIAFNPNARPDDADYGKLYIGVGDGANTVLVDGQVDSWGNAQNKRVPLGKILRIDPLAGGGRPYGVPRDNPFVGDEQALAEIWALGLRNPQRFSWDRGGDHKMLIADIGQSQLEEIDVGRAGANYGWGEREGTRMIRHGDATYRLGLPLLDFLAGYTYPALVYGHHLGLAVTGGYVYRGSAMPQLRGMYVFGDIVSGKIFFTDAQALRDGGQAVFYELPLQFRGAPGTLRQIVGAPRADLRFGVDDRGEIYVLTKQDGMIRRLSALVPAEAAIWPVEYPVDPLGSSFWESMRERLEATLRAFMSWR